MDHKFFIIFIANRIFMRFSIYYMYCLNISCVAFYLVVIFWGASQCKNKSKFVIHSICAYSIEKKC